MPPKLILIRHAEAEHNKTKNYELPDPSLTERGREQSQTLHDHLRRKFPEQNIEVDLIIVSPMRRCIQTARIGLDFLINPAPGGKKVPIEAHAGWQENSAKPCDTGSTLDGLTDEFPFVDFSKVDKVYPDKTSERGARYAHSAKAISARAHACLAELHARPEGVIVVVSHSGFLRLGVTGARYANADYRIFEFEERLEGAAADETYRLRQSELTLAGGLGTCPTDSVPFGRDLRDEHLTGLGLGAAAADANVPKEDQVLP